MVPADALSKLQHLRRVAKPEFVPNHIRDDDPSGGPGRKNYYKGQLSYLVLCPCTLVDRIQLHRTLGSRAGAHLFRPLIPCIRAIKVPAQAPVNAATADEWSEKYWPTVYKNTNPYGPHPAIVRRAELEVLGSGLDGHTEEGNLTTWMAMARKAGTLCKTARQGCGAGAVVIDRTSPVAGEGTTGASKEARIVVVAGDARSTGITHGKGDNMLGHAVMRAIGLIATKRRLLATDTLDLEHSNEPHKYPEYFLDAPLNELEKHHLYQPTLAPNGYLCVDLELYLTHEPCVMCSMALLHSRFARVVFEQPMTKTGAITTEESNKQQPGGLGYGLFWRSELNWRCLAWKCENDNPTSKMKNVPRETEAVHM